MSDPISGLYETATYCKVGDEKRPTLVGLPDFTTTTLCDEDPSVPAEAAEAAPGSWYVRIMFDELLDPSIEELIPILDEQDQETGTFVGSLANTQPVTLECEGVDGMFHNVEYDGYYSPSGNAVTWPVGPSLVIRPLDASIVPVLSECRVTIKSGVVKDKSGEPVPSDQLGPFTFSTQPVAVVDTFPGNGATVNSDQMFLFDYEFMFNTVIDPASFTFPEDVTVDPATTDPADTGTYADGPFGFVYSNWTPGTEFALTLSPNAMVADACGKETPLRNELGTDTVSFTTRPGALLSVTPAQGTGIAPARFIRIDFNTPILCGSTATCSLEPTEYTVTPAIDGMALTSSTGDRGTIFVLGNYQINTEYTFTINAGATVRDIYNTTDITIAEAQSVTFTTGGIALTASTVTCTAAGVCAFAGGVLTKFDPAAGGRVQLAFNANMNPASLTADEFTLTTAAGAPVSGVTVTGAGTAVRVDAAALAAGSYTFTLKAGATIEDALGNVYTQAADRVVNFVVAVDDSVPEPHLCLGQTAAR